MPETLKELFYFQVVKPDKTFSVSIMSDRVIIIKERDCGKKHQTKKQLSNTELELFFSDLEKLELSSWPPNLDCCACDDSSWEVMADYEGKKKRCFGVFGFEPNTWPKLLTLVERTIGKKISLNILFFPYVVIP